MSLTGCNKQNRIMSVDLSPFELVIQGFESGAVVRSVTELSGGISCTMTRVDVESAAGAAKSFVVRMVGKWSIENYPESAKNEFELLTYLGDHGIPVPKPRYFDLSCSILPRPYLVFDYVDGSPDLTVTNIRTRVVAMANQLADIHQLDVAHPAFSFMKPSPVNIRPPENEPNEELQETKIRRALADYLPHVAENSYRFRHGDFWPGNMLWKDDKLAAVIDWEETSIGDPLFDVAIARLDILWAYGFTASVEFLRQYKVRMDINFRHLPFWDLRVSLRPVTNLATWAKSLPQLGRPDVTEEVMATRHRWFVDQAILKLELLASRRG